MAPQKNLTLIFGAIPTGMPVPEQFVLKDIGFDPSTAPPPNGLVLQHIYLSLDPYMRSRLRPEEVKSYVPAFKLHEPISNDGIARVLASNNANFGKGDIVKGRLKFQQFSTVADPSAFEKVDVVNGDPDLRNYLGALGMPGLTAYSSLYEIGRPKRGETIFVSSAAGAVGQVVGQISKHEGLRVIGSVGSEAKLKFITDDLGFDGGFNYKSEKPTDALKRLAPNGIDIYFENVGGEQLEAAIGAMNDYGRIVACGMISDYGTSLEKRYGVRNLVDVVTKRLTMRGFIVTDECMGPKWKEEHIKTLTKWLKDGSFKAVIDETVGMEKAAEAFIGMLQGKNFGKAVLKVEKDE